MKGSRIHGWQAVYRFSLKEHLKGMPFQVMTALVCVLLLCSLPIVHWATQTVQDTPATKVSRLYIVDETGLSLDYSSFCEQREYRNVKVERTSRSVSEIIAELQELGKRDKTALAQIRYDGGELLVNMYYGEKSAIGEMDLSSMGEALLSFYRQHAADNFLSAEQGRIVERTTEASITKIKQNVLPEMARNINTIEYAVITVISCLAMMFVAISGEGIASSIVTEKSSKITEYLLTSVKPLALIVGKVLSVMSAVFIQFLLMALSLGASWGMVKLLGGNDLNLSAVLGGDIRIQPAGAVGAVLFFALGLVLYGMMAGVVGASVSRVEETSEGLKLYNIVLIGCSVLGVLAARLGATGEYRLLVAIAVLCPLSSPFIVPAYLALGKLSVWMGVLSLLILILTVIAVAYFVAGVYEALIFYRGSHLKLKNILKMAVGRKVAK